jgi:hypothetical protein
MDPRDRGALGKEQRALHESLKDPKKFANWRLAERVGVFEREREKANESA